MKKVISSVMAVLLAVIMFVSSFAVEGVRADSSSGGVSISTGKDSGENVEVYFQDSRLDSNDEPFQIFNLVTTVKKVELFTCMKVRLYGSGNAQMVFL